MEDITKNTYWFGNGKYQELNDLYEDERLKDFVPEELFARLEEVSKAYHRWYRYAEYNEDIGLDKKYDKEYEELIADLNCPNASKYDFDICMAYEKLINDVYLEIQHYVDEAFKKAIDNLSVKDLGKKIKFI